VGCGCQIRRLSRRGYIGPGVIGRCKIRFYNIGGCNEKKNLEIVNTVCGLLDELRPNDPIVPHRNLTTFVKDRLGHARHWQSEKEAVRPEDVADGLLGPSDYQRWQMLSGFSFMMYTPALLYMVSTEMTDRKTQYLLATIVVQIIPMTVMLLATQAWAPGVQPAGEFRPSPNEGVHFRK